MIVYQEPHNPKSHRGALWAVFLLLIAAGIAGCSSAPKTTNDTSAAAVAPTPAPVDPFAILDAEVTAGNIDPHIFQERVDAARQEWLRALVSQQKNEKTEVSKAF